MGAGAKGLVGFDPSRGGNFRNFAPSQQQGLGMGPESWDQSKAFAPQSADRSSAQSFFRPRGANQQSPTNATPSGITAPASVSGAHPDGSSPTSPQPARPSGNAPTPSRPHGIGPGSNSQALIQALRAQ